MCAAKAAAEGADAQLALPVITDAAANASSSLVDFSSPAKRAQLPRGPNHSTNCTLQQCSRLTRSPPSTPARRRRRHLSRSSTTSMPWIEQSVDSSRPSVFDGGGSTSRELISLASCTRATQRKSVPRWQTTTQRSELSTSGSTPSFGKSTVSGRKKAYSQHNQLSSCRMRATE